MYTVDWMNEWTSEQTNQHRINKQINKPRAIRVNEGANKQTMNKRMKRVKEQMKKCWNEGMQNASNGTNVQINNKSTNQQLIIVNYPIN